MDTALETSAPLVFAAGNLIHPAETADVAALSGQHAARHIAAALACRAGPAGPAGTGPAGTGPRVPLAVEPPLRWISPSAVRPPLLPPRGRFLLRCDSFHPAGWIEVRQGARCWPGPGPAC